jgi:hypothetical protein
MYKNYKQEVTDLFHEFQIELIVNDEVEQFRNYDDTQFYYPYQKRKEVLNQVGFQIDPSMEISEDYEFVSSMVNFKISQTCLEENVFS